MRLRFSFLVGIVVLLFPSGVFAGIVNFSYAWALLTKQLQGEHLTPEEQLYVDAARDLPSSAVRRVPMPAIGGPREFYVDNERGDDAASGLAGTPVRSLARASALLRPGDTLHFVVNAKPYRDVLQLFDVTGVPGHPIVIDGHGATITGSDPIEPADWTEVAPNLYRNKRLIDQLVETNDATKLKRMFFHFAGVQQRMGRTSKGTQAPFKAPADLQPGEWTFENATRAFYVRINGSLADARITAPMRRCGVVLLSLQGIENLVIRNITVTAVLNDGFNLHGFGIKQVRFEDIAAYECGDDGFSPHEDVECVIDGYRASRNSTALVSANCTVTQAGNLRFEGNYGIEVMAAHGSVMNLHDASIMAGEGTMPLSLSRPESLRLTLANVRLSAPSPQRIEIPAGVTLEARALTALGPDWSVSGAVRITESVIAARRIECVGNGTWQAEDNVYDPELAVPAANDRNASRAKITTEILRSTGRLFPAAGADLSAMRVDR